MAGLNLEKKKNNNKYILGGGILGVIVIIIIAITGYCFYENSQLVDQFNAQVKSLNTTVASIKGNDEHNIDFMRNKSFKFGNIANSFEELSTKKLLGNKNRGLAKNYSEEALYLQSTASLYAKIEGFTQQLNTIGTPGPQQIEELISQVEGLENSQELKNMTKIYESNEAVRKNVSKQITPEVFENRFNKAISGFSEVKGYEQFGNNLSESITGGQMFGEDPFFSVDNSNVNNAPMDDDDDSTAGESSSDIQVNQSSTPSYTQALHQLSGKYEDMISNEQDKYGHSSQLILSGNPSEDNQRIDGYYNTWDAMLNDVWGDLKANLPESQMKALTTQEMEWIKTKEGKSKAEQAELTKQRTMKLLDEYIFTTN